MFYLMCMGVLPAHMPGDHLCSWYPGRLEEGARYPETRIAEDCELPCGYWEPFLYPLEE